ncbi:prolyl oligopeptidase family serine peptidase [Nocardioides aestuarii]|uniref:Alpha/beta hydrolase family protein n=1 Tax=Nocardioides aestuarii TaxID=252231 RepID=A0ABW4TK62_9ACTN
MAASPEGRFPRNRLHTVRPAPGPLGLALVVFEQPHGARGRVWSSLTGELGDDLPVPVSGDTVLTADGRWLVDLDDDGGSEVGTLVARRVDGSETRQLTPGRDPYVLRGLEAGADGAHVLATLVDEAGHHLVLIPLDDPSKARTIFSSVEEAWWGHLSADGALASVDTTEHNPGVRRAAVTVVDTATGDVVGVADDLPAGPVRAVRFSPSPGDPRVLLWTERSGYSRPAIWDPLTGARRDYELSDLAGETLVLDWSPERGEILVVHVDAGVHRLLCIDEQTGDARAVLDDAGSFADPDVASVWPYYWKSFLGGDGRPVVLTSSATTPLHARQVMTDGSVETVVKPAAVPPGRTFASVVTPSADGTPVHFWWATPAGGARGTIVEVHGGPNLVTVDTYRPELQAWLDHGFAVAALNYRGSVTFGQAYREGFWGGASDGEIADIDAAVGWLRGQGLADPATTFITGPSFGGHLSLLSVGRLPDRFAGALAVVAMADWEAAWAEVNPAIRKSWTGFLSMKPDGTADPRRIDEVLARFSAVSHVDDVTASVWLHQGRRDTRTPPTQAQRYVDRLREAGGDVVIDWFDAGHEPTGVEGMEVEFGRSLELVEATLAGRRWDGLPGLYEK